MLVVQFLCVGQVLTSTEASKLFALLDAVQVNEPDATKVKQETPGPSVDDGENQVVEKEAASVDTSVVILERGKLADDQGFNAADLNEINAEEHKTSLINVDALEEAGTSIVDDHHDNADFVHGSTCLEVNATGIEDQEDIVDVHLLAFENLNDIAVEEDDGSGDSAAPVPINLKTELGQNNHDL